MPFPISAGCEARTILLHILFVAQKDESYQKYSYAKRKPNNMLPGFTLCNTVGICQGIEKDQTLLKELILHVSKCILIKDLLIFTAQKNQHGIHQKLSYSIRKSSATLGLITSYSTSIQM